MIDNPAAQAGTGLSPEWDRWFDEAFTDLVTHDDDLLRQEFDDLVQSSWPQQAPPISPSPGPPAQHPVGPSASERRREPGNEPRPVPLDDEPRPPP
jgi:hypothetical protein